MIRNLDDLRSVLDDSGVTCWAAVGYTPVHREKQELKDHYFQRVKGVRNAPIFSYGLPCGDFASIGFPRTGS
jgi:hypothetical protein